MTQLQLFAHRKSLTASTLVKAPHNLSVLLLLFLFCLVAGSSQAWAGITIGTPGASAQIVSPVPFSATATSATGLAITTMKVYLDGNPSEIGAYTGNGTSSLTVNATFAMGTGTHNFGVNAWDSGGALYQSSVSFTVSTTGVVIAAPTQNETVTSPVSFSATATSNGLNITAMNVYLDFNSTPMGAYTGNGTPSLHETASYTIASGPHIIITNAWDSSGQIYQSSVNFTVGTSGSGAIPPSNATLTPNIDNMTNWGYCSSLSCSGHGGGPATDDPTYGVHSPQLESGGSMELLVTGTADADLLHWNNLPANENFNHFVLDYYFQVDNIAPVQALEFDFEPGTPSQKYNFSNQCDNSNPSNPVWDTWDEPTMSWTSSGISCATVLNVNNWHHIRLYGEILNRGLSTAQTHYIWIEVDGVQHNFTTNSTHNAVSKAWDKLAVNAQQDINSTGGTYHIFIDQMNLYVW